MPRDRDTSSKGAAPSVEPSQPTAARFGGAATPPVRSAPPGPWPKPFSRPSTFIYGARWCDDAYQVHFTANPCLEDFLREDNFSRRLMFTLGVSRAADIISGHDERTNSDIAAWERLGA